MTTKLERIREDAKNWYQYFSENITRYRAMKWFNAGNQWTYEQLTEYQANQKEPLVLNLCQRFITQVAGEMLTNQPGVTVSAKSEEVSAELVELRNDLIRTILDKENFDQAQQACMREALGGGWGVLYVYTQYEDGITFNQEAKIETINDSSLAVFDPSATKPTKSDGEFAGLVNLIPEQEFKRRWKNKIPSTKSFLPEPVNNYIYNTTGQKQVQVFDHYRKHHKKVRVCLVAPALNGKESETIRKKDFPLYIKKFREQERQKQMIAELQGKPYQPAEEPQIYQEREADMVHIKCTRCTYEEILEEYEWMSERLPVIFVPGRFIYLEGAVQIMQSYTQDVVDIQRFINYLWSEMVLYVRRARKESFVATPEMVKGYEDIWRNPERVQGLLLANFDARLAGGPGGGLPNQIPALPTIPPVLIEFYQAAVETMMQILGRTQASLGLQGNERSGIAIEKRRMQESYGTTATYQYLMYATEEVGLIVNDLVSNLYDNQRNMVLKRKNGETYPVTLNKYNSDTDEVQNNLSDTDVLVSVDSGSNYEQQSQEEFDKMAQLLQFSSQPAFPYMAPLMARTLKSEITNELVECLEFMQPPALRAQLKGQPAPPSPPDPQAQLEQAKVQVAQQQLALKGQIAQQDFEIKSAQNQTAQQKNQIEAMNNILDFQSNMAAHKAEVSKAAIEGQQNIVDSHTHKIKHAADIMKNFNSLMQIGQQQNSAGGQSNAQPQQ